MGLSLQQARNIALSIVTVLAFAIPLGSRAETPKFTDCYRLLTGLQYNRFAHDQLGDNTPVILYANGTEVPLARAMEKEGLLYSDIAEWFPSARPGAAKKLRDRLADELSGAEESAQLTRWLKRYAQIYLPEGLDLTAQDWAAMSPEKQLRFILRDKDFFRRINVQGREDLFYDEILTFDDLLITEKTPKRLTVGDDLGSYEVRSDGGTIDRTTYIDDRKVVEDFLEGKVGHQHKVHAWPIDKAQREMMAPRYIELLDATTWYLYWRQLKRNPSEVESILSHPYLGVYTRYWLERLYKAVIDMEPAEFKNKYRMVGARNFEASPEIPNQDSAGPIVPDWELRSGNKTDNRNFVEDLVEARIASGDYNGLEDFTTYHFDAAAPIDALTYRFLSGPEIEILKEFENQFSLMNFSRQANAHNHQRTKIIAPLLPWENRLNIPYKILTLHEAQKRYARRLLSVASDYLAKMKRLSNPESIAELRADTLTRLERSAYRFAKDVRLDMDFERYLTPVPRQLPSITVKSDGPIDVNDMAIGIEYSFRFPSEMEITSREIAEREIQRMIMTLQSKIGGGKVERIADGGHGHGVSVRYRYTDPYGRVWRAEWDGVQRRYIKGKVVDPHGGHVEIPTPKFKPTDPYRDIAPVFNAARENGQFPIRAAGGGHVNTDLAPLKGLPEAEGVEKVKNLIGYFESNRELITFLWQHPRRGHAARPIELKEGFGKRLASFKGGWNDLAVFLYNEQYFNTYVGRKPRYVEMDLTGLIAPAVPDAYKKGTLDIKNPKQEWFPDFGTGKDRVEFRLYDAPTNEYLAALQIKYHRALLNKALNSATPIPYELKYADNAKDLWRQDPKAFVAAAEAHLIDLGLDVNEFRPLILEAWQIHQTPPPAPRQLQKYDKWLPAKDPTTSSKKTVTWFLTFENRICA